MHVCFKTIPLAGGAVDNGLAPSFGRGTVSAARISCAIRSQSPFTCTTIGEPLFSKTTKIHVMTFPRVREGKPDNVLQSHGPAGSETFEVNRHSPLR